jgi:acetyl esterase/lipase
MRKTIVLATLLALPGVLWAQKKPLDHSVYDSWQSVSATALSPKGNVLSYEVNPQEGDGVLTFRVFGKKGREITVERGYRASILDDESFAVCLIKPQFAKTRRAKIDKKKADQMPQDSLAVINLRSGAVVKFPNVKGYRLGKHALKAFAFASTDTSLVPQADRKEKDMGSTLLVYRFANGQMDTLQHIDKYEVTQDGLRMGLVRKTGKKGYVTGFYSLEEGASFFTDTVTWHAVPRFNEAGSAALFLVARDTVSSGSKHAELYRYDVSARETRKLAGPEGLGTLPQGWGLTENSSYAFSHDGERIHVGVQELTPPEDTSLVSFELPGLDIWNWDAPQLPPQQKVNLKGDAAYTFPVRLSQGGAKLLNDTRLVRYTLGNRGDGPYDLKVRIVNPVETQWNFQNTVEVSVVGDQAETLVARGELDDISLSPLAKHVIWWDYRQQCWNIYDIAAGQTRILAPGVDFFQEDDDHPMMKESYGIAGWLEGENALLLYDRYDIWKAPVDGSAPVRLTAGRESGITYRYVNTKDREEERHIGLAETILMSLFDNATKENGVASLNMGNPAKSFKTLMKGGYSWSGVKKAAKADVYAYQKGNFQLPMDVYYTADMGKSEQKISAINPQQKDYNWGTVELYHWNAYDGTKLDGLLYKPEDFDPARKYPVMIYFYEKNSETLYNHITVQPSWSIINITFYVSRGYIVFVPDIVYASGIPGESAVNCICSGAESLTRFPWIDKDNMAIQGQSWGGYQVAYLITRTDMFKCAGAGAPVSNMTSAYGGIRWESGNSRQGQYEQGQSRIGRRLWDGIELYMENSPLFKLPNVTTPVLIMHNDADGAVPWYQGIEMFMGLRRLGKPAWLLEYNDEAHNLRERRNRKDLTIRLQQFFDYYLKGAPQPAWMKEGVPTLKKNRYFGYETDAEN